MTKKLTSIRQNFHLYQTKSGRYCYRQVIPKDVRHLFTISEFKRSLYTDNIYNANLSGLLISRIINICINNIRNKADYCLNITEINASIAKIINNNKGGVFAHDIINTLSILKDNDVSLQAVNEFASDMPISGFIGSEYGGTKIGTKSIPTKSISLQEAIKNYKDDMILKNKWSIKTAYQMGHSNNLLLELLGNICIDKITREALNDVLRRLMRYPRNKNKLSKYRDLSIKELDNIDIPAGEANHTYKTFSYEFQI